MAADQRVAAPRRAAVAEPAIDLDPAEAEAPQFAVERRHRAMRADPVDVAEAPVERQSRHPERVGLGGQHDAAVRIRRLLGPQDGVDALGAALYGEPRQDRAGRFLGSDDGLLCLAPEIAAQPVGRQRVLQRVVGAPGRGHAVVGRLSGGERERGVQQAVALLQRLGRTAEGGVAPAAMPMRARQQVQQPPGPVGDDAAAAGMRVLHEVAADQIVRVAEAVGLHVARGQQQTRYLQPAGRQHHRGGADMPAAAAQVGDLEPLDGAAGGIGPDVGDGGVQQDAHIGGVDQVPAAAQREAVGPLVELPQIDAELGRIERRRRQAEPPPGRLVGGVGIEPELALGRGVIGRQRVGPERPAAVRNPVPAREVDGVEPGAAAAPDRRGAAEEAQPRIDERVIVEAADIAAGEILYLGLEIGAAALQQQDLAPLPAQRPGQRDAGRAGADDADVGPEVGGVGASVEIVEHGSGESAVRPPWPEPGARLHHRP